METGRDSLGRFVRGEPHPGFIDGESKTRERQKEYHKKWREENVPLGQVVTRVNVVEEEPAPANVDLSTSAVPNASQK